MKYVDLQQLPQEPVSHNPEIQKQVMLRAGDLPHLTNFSQARFSPGQVAIAHRHLDMAEVFFVEAGQGEIRVEQTVYSLSPGVCVAVEPGEEHEVTNTSGEFLVLTYLGLRVPEALVTQLKNNQ